MSTPTIVIGKPAPKATVARSNAVLSAAVRRGQVVETAEKQFNAGNKRSGPVDGKQIAKMDRTDDVIVQAAKIEATVSKSISKARNDKGLSQKELAVKVNEKPSVIAEYESGKAIPSQQVLTKMERILGVKLRGKGIGEPLPPRGGDKAAAAAEKK
ncbi:hypothetical protein GQ42DRAFT_126290 [Ramicandelaber brevisporus]|nr:hypothetical protein GQ42DRAFT_126290 [Ramicandelaber brevisporus]